MWSLHVSYVTYHTSHVTCETVLAITFSPIPMPHHHVSVKPQGCINAEFWVGPAQECGKPPTLPCIHEEKYSIVAHHQPLQCSHIRSNLLYGLGYTTKSEEVDIWAIRSRGVWTLHVSIHKRSNLGAVQRKLAGSSVMTYESYLMTAWPMSKHNRIASSGVVKLAQECS